MTGTSRTPAEVAAYTNIPTTLGEVYIKEILPDIESSYRVLSDRENRAMAGLSMGGSQTARIALNRLDLFASIGIFSGAVEGLSYPEVTYGGVFSDAAQFNSRVRLFWAGAGTAETSQFERMEAYKETLDELGIEAVYYISEGTAHEWHTWRRFLHEFAPLLFK